MVETTSSRIATSLLIGDFLSYDNTNNKKIMTEKKNRIHRAFIDAKVRWVPCSGSEPAFAMPHACCSHRARAYRHRQSVLQTLPFADLLLSLSRRQRVIAP